jgi:hypothetical protein
MFRYQSSPLAIVMAILMTGPSAGSMTIKEFRGKLSSQERGLYIGAAVAMLGYHYAANGNVAKATCIRTWFFGDRKGGEPRGAREITIEEGVAANLDPDRFHIEGIIEASVEKACGAEIPRPASKP